MFTVGIPPMARQHRQDDPRCPACPPTWPRECKCGGLLHEQIGEQYQAGDVAYRKCSACGALGSAKPTPNLFIP